MSVTKSNTNTKIKGPSGFEADTTDHGALQITPVPEGKTAFGEQIFAEPHPRINEKFARFINPIVFQKQQNNGASISQSNNMAQVSSGSNTSAHGTLVSWDTIRYIAGEGIACKFAGIFDTPGEANTQEIGIGNAADGFFFGYNGTKFGILHRQYGQFEIQALEITAHSVDAENITITLDGVAASVPVTVKTDPSETANEIAAFDFKDIGEGWTARAVGDFVYFVSWAAKAQNGTYSISGSSVTGSFTRKSTGLEPTENWYYQDQTETNAWTGRDVFNGEGDTTVNLNPQSGNVFKVAYQYLGFGAAFFYIEDPDDGELHLVHTIEYANANTRPLLGNPSLPFWCRSKNDGAGTSKTIKLSSCGLFHQGMPETVGVRHGVEARKTNLATGKPIISFRCKEVFQGQLNTGKNRILKLSVSAENTKPVAIAFYANMTLTKAEFNNSDLGDNSMIEFDVAADSATGGTYLFSVNVGKSGQAVLDLDNSDYETRLIPGNIFTAIVVSAGGNSDVNVSANIVDLYG